MPKRPRRSTISPPVRPPFTLDELAVFAGGARLAYLLRRRDLRTIFFARAEAFGEFRAAHEASGLRELIHHCAAAERAREFGRSRSHVGKFFYLILALHRFRERSVKIFQCFLIFALAFGYLVELILHLRGERVADVLLEMFLAE